MVVFFVLYASYGFYITNIFYIQRYGVSFGGRASNYFVIESNPAANVANINDGFMGAFPVCAKRDRLFSDAFRRVHANLCNCNDRSVPRL